MDAGISFPRKLFDGTVHFEIPVYQRPYVWNEEDQWAPLWKDIRRLTDNLIHAQNRGENEDSVRGHFLGAVVVKAKPAKSGDVTRFEVVDGQQRMTTMQLMLTAARDTLAKHPQFEDQAEAISELTTNNSARFRGKPSQFKLHPSRGDRAAFTAVLTDKISDELTDHRLVQASRFFRSKIEEWIFDSSPDTPGTPDQRVGVLTEVLEGKLQVVSIDLDGGEDDQLIFETLNDRGTPLLKADLIKNWVFARGDSLGADVEHWADTYWAAFDDDWWREEVRQGRMFRPRVDTFLQYWLTMRTITEIPSRDVFASFRAYAQEAMTSVEGSEKLLTQLQDDAEFYRELSTHEVDDAAGRFYQVVIQTFDLAAFMPLLLKLSSPSYRFAEEQVAAALTAIESWVVRRTLLRETTRGVSQLAVALLKAVDDVGRAVAGDAAVAYLAGQTSGARYWPTDNDLLETAPRYRVYGQIRQNRLRVILEGVESQLRTERHEKVSLPADLQIEHLMPQQWRRYWDTTPPMGDEDAAAVSKAVDCLGNLTLTTGKLNGSLSNRPWTDEETQEAVPEGQRRGIGKRSLISQFSLLALNKEIVDNHPDEWTVDDIEKRSVHLLEKVCQAWPRSPVMPQRGQ